MHALQRAINQSINQSVNQSTPYDSLNASALKGHVMRLSFALSWESLPAKASMHFCLQCLAPECRALVRLLWILPKPIAAPSI